VIPVCPPGSSKMKGDTTCPTPLEWVGHVAAVQFSRAAERAPAGFAEAGLSKLNSMLGLELRELRGRTKRRTAGIRECGSRLARPGSVDVLGRTVGDRWLASVRVTPKGERRTAGHGAVPCGSQSGTP
jgi:hypothetical protein